MSSSSTTKALEPTFQEMARVNEELSLTVKWNGKEYNFMVRPNDSIGSLKHQIWEATRVRVVHQKLLYPKIGLIRNDFQLLSNVPIRSETKMIMIGTVEDDFIVDPVTPIQIVDDFEESNDFVHIKDAMISKKNLERRINDYEIRVLHQCRTSTKLLVLDVDCTILDHRSREPMRPGLHEFLSAVYADYDIIIWSSSSMNWAEFKLEQVGVLNNPSYRITAILDRFAMTTVRHDSGSFFDCKPLCLLWNRFQEFYKPSNTIVIDDLRRNFVMNPENGLMIRRFRKAHARQADEELSKLAKYLLAIVGLDDFSQLDHRKWEMYPI